MQVKTVNQFICDFCGKKQYARAAMNHHEKHCTKNPGRSCRMCEIVENPGPGVATLVAILKDDEKLPKERMAAIRDLTDCPACILAAIRQSGIWEAYISEPCDVDTGEAFSFGDAHNWNGPTWEFGEMPQFLGFSYKKEKTQILAENRRREIGVYTENYC